MGAPPRFGNAAAGQPKWSAHVRRDQDGRRLGSLWRSKTMLRCNRYSALRNLTLLLCTVCVSARSLVPASATSLAARDLKYRCLGPCSFCERSRSGGGSRAAGATEGPAVEAASTLLECCLRQHGFGRCKCRLCENRYWSRQGWFLRCQRRPYSDQQHWSFRTRWNTLPAFMRKWFHAALQRSSRRQVCS